MKTTVPMIDVDLWTRLHNPAVADGPEATVHKKRGPRSRRSLQHIGNFVYLPIREDSQIVPGLARSPVCPSNNLQDVNRMRREDIGKSSTSHVFVCVGDSSADCQIPVLCRHPLRKQCSDSRRIVFRKNRYSNVFRCGYEILRLMPSHPVPKPVSDVPCSDGSIDCSKCPELRVAVNQPGAVELLNLKTELGYQVLPRAKVKRLPAVRDWGRNCHKPHQSQRMTALMLSLSARRVAADPSDMNAQPHTAGRNGGNGPKEKKCT